MLVMVSPPQFGFDAVASIACGLQLIIGIVTFLYLVKGVLKIASSRFSGVQHIGSLVQMA